MLIVFTILIIIAATATAEGVSYTGHKSHISASARIRSGRAWDGRREEGNNERYNSRSSCVVILANCYDPNHVGRSVGLGGKRRRARGEERCGRPEMRWIVAEDGFILGAGTRKAPRRRVLRVVNSEKSCHGRGSCHGRATKCIFLTINMWVPENDGKRRKGGGEEMQTTFSSTLIPAARQVHRFDGLAIISSHVRALPCALPPSAQSSRGAAAAAATAETAVKRDQIASLSSL